MIQRRKDIGMTSWYTTESGANFDRHPLLLTVQASSTSSPPSGWSAVGWSSGGNPPARITSYNVCYTKLLRIGFGDIACSVKRTGQPWSAPQNVTQTPMTDERFVSIAKRNAGGMAHLFYQSSATNEAA